MFRLQKIARRKAAVDTLDWEDSKKERCKKFLIADYTSSDESEMSEDENGLDVKRFVTKRLSWEGVKLTELKNFLDLAYKRSLSPHLRNLQTERVVGNKGFSTLCSKVDCSSFTTSHQHPCPERTQHVMYE